MNRFKKGNSALKSLKGYLFAASFKVQLSGTNRQVARFNFTRRNPSEYQFLF